MLLKQYRCVQQKAVGCNSTCMVGGGGRGGGGGGGRAENKGMHKKYSWQQLKSTLTAIEDGL